jgi:dUTP pyrophosphatase
VRDGGYFASELSFKRRSSRTNLSKDKTIPMMKLALKKLDARAKLPDYAHTGDAGMDMYALEPVTIKPGERIDVRTGIAMEIPTHYVGLIWDKSGVSLKHGIKVLGGVVDAGYRGEIRIGLINHGSKPVSFEAGQKVAQMLIQRVSSPQIIEVTELSDTERGEGGFGSTGQ